MQDVYKRQDLWLALSDANIAAQNAVTAAWSLGLGSCYIGDILEHAERHRELLNLPEYVVPAAMAVFGYPTAQQLERTKPARRALEHIVHENAYRRMDAGELEAMLAGNAGARPYADWLDAFCRRKYNSDFSREMCIRDRRHPHRHPVGHPARPLRLGGQAVTLIRIPHLPI